MREPHAGQGFAVFGTIDGMPLTYKPPLTIYFDGSCPLCQREIGFYRRMPAAQSLAWVDVSQSAELGAGLDCRQAMARFHVRDAKGQLFSGAAGFSRLWRELPGWRWLGRLSAIPPVSWLAELAYRAFLPVRPLLQRGLNRWLGAQAGGR
jgi:predicted DCC family thiol-disulfide oxidoreductase YuxK